MLSRRETSVDRAWLGRGGGRGGGRRAVTIALERHDVVHVHTDDRCVYRGDVDGGEGERAKKTKRANAA